jgi:hypothetical protein
MQARILCEDNLESLVEPCVGPDCVPVVKADKPKGTSAIRLAVPLATDLGKSVTLSNKLTSFISTPKSRCTSAAICSLSDGGKFDGNSKKEPSGKFILSIKQFF